MIYKSIFSMMTLLSINSFSYGSEVRYADISMSGKGCTQENSRAIVSPDQDVVSILFDNLTVEVPKLIEDDFSNFGSYSRGGIFDVNQDQKICNINIDAGLKRGYKVDSVEISADFRGATVMDYGTQAMFDSRLLKIEGMNTSGHRVRSVLARAHFRNGSFDEDWAISEDKVIPVNSSCSNGYDAIKMTLKNTLKAKILDDYINSDVSAFIGIDSADFQGKLKVKIKTSSCYDDGYNRRRRPTRRDRGLRCKRGQKYSKRIGKCVKSSRMYL